MAGGDRRPHDLYHDWLVDAGRNNFNQLFDDEVHTMADNHSKDENYRLFRRHAVRFIENHYKDSNFDALIPYMAMTYVDRFHLNMNQIPTVVEPRGRNTNLFLICCLITSWKHFTEIFVSKNFLKEKQLDFTVGNVEEMEGHICRQLGEHMLTVMPFEFIQFFTPFLNLPLDSSSALRPVYQLIVKSQFDIAFTEFRPSVMAASALQIVTSKVFTDQVEAFHTYVINSEFLKPVQAVIAQCTMMLEPLYSKIPAPVDKDALGGASSSAAPRRSKPIQIPQSTRREGKQHTFYDEEPTPDKGKEPAFDGELSSLEDKELGVDEGDKAAAGEIHQQQERRDYTDEVVDLEMGLNEAPAVVVMNFELGWIEAQGEPDQTLASEPEREEDSTSYLFQWFSRFCNIL